MNAVFSTIKNNLETLANRHVRGPSFDPAVFEDDIASQVDWSPARGGGANFCTHQFFRVNNDRFEFRPTPFARLFGGIFVLAGIGVGSMSFFSEALGPGGRDADKFWMVLGFGALFASIGLVLLWVMNRRRVFDHENGFFYIGKPPERNIETDSGKRWARLSHIHALQIVSERVSGNKRSYTSYELNLVLKDASRINVVDHGHGQKLRDDVRQLAVLLDLPVWDATVH